MARDEAFGPVPDPRSRADLVGQDAAADALRRAATSGRLHHAWLLGGPEGIGKATLAYRFARWLLAPEEERRPSPDGLGVDPGGKTFRQVAAGAHPNLVTLERAGGEGDKAAPKTVKAEEVRRVLGFFAQTAADGGHRICIVDAVEDLNLTGVNALLKTVEEPPPRGLVLIVSHAPQRVLPTVRSRCRRLLLPPLPDPALRQILVGLGEGGPAPAPAVLDPVVATAGGSVRRALSLLDGRTLVLLKEVSGLLDGLPEVPTRRVLSLAEKLNGKGAEADLALTLDRVRTWLSARVRAQAAAGPARLAPLAELCENLADASNAAETFNLDRRPLVLSLFGELAEAVRRTS